MKSRKHIGGGTVFKLFLCVTAIVIDIFNDQVLQCTVVIQLPYSKDFIHTNAILIFRTDKVRLMRVAFECLAGTQYSYTPSIPHPLVPIMCRFCIPCHMK